MPLARAENNGYYQEMVGFLRNMLGAALKTNDSLKLAVLTGCLRISKESIFTGLNNFKCFGIADVRFADKFGFTAQEVDALLHAADLSAKKAVMKEWYDGYRFGKNTEIYCPWDILQYVSDLQSNASAKPQAYWNNTSGNALVRSFVGRTELHIGHKFENLLAGGCVEVNIVESLTYDSLHSSEDNLWSLLYDGFLTKASPEQKIACVSRLTSTKTPLVILIGKSKKYSHRPLLHGLLSPSSTLIEQNSFNTFGTEIQPNSRNFLLPNCTQPSAIMMPTKTIITPF